MVLLHRPVAALISVKTDRQNRGFIHIPVTDRSRKNFSTPECSITDLPNCQS